MTCTVYLTEKPELNNPILIEGLPGIGFVANIATLHLINELKAPMFGEIRSSSFQDFAVTSGNGKARFPTNELYYTTDFVTGKVSASLSMWNSTRCINLAGFNYGGGPPG